MNLDSHSTNELKAEIDRRSMQPLVDYAKAIGYSQRMMNSLRQTETWTTREGETISLDEIADSHRTNLIAWLERRAIRLKICAEFEFVLVAISPFVGDDARDAIDTEQMVLTDMDALDWLHETPLMQKLRSLAGAVA